MREKGNATVSEEFQLWTVRLGQFGQGTNEMEALVSRCDQSGHAAVGQELGRPVRIRGRIRPFCSSGFGLLTGFAAPSAAELPIRASRAEGESLAVVR